MTRLDSQYQFSQGDYQVPIALSADECLRVSCSCCAGRSLVDPAAISNNARKAGVWGDFSLLLAANAAHTFHTSHHAMLPGMALELVLGVMRIQFDPGPFASYWCASVADITRTGARKPSRLQASTWVAVRSFCMVRYSSAIDRLASPSSSGPVRACPASPFPDSPFWS